MTIDERYKYLQDTIAKANESYFSDEPSNLSDSEYDDIMKEIADIEAANPQFKVASSVTEVVGTSRKESGFEKCLHTRKMLSIANSLTPDEFTNNWYASTLEAVKKPFSMCIERKIDGASLSLVYINRVLERAVTRGDGETGDLVTDNAKVISTVPHTLPETITIGGTTYKVPDELEVRGEVYMSRESFAAYNRKLEAAGKEPAANPRNTASGSLKLKDPVECASRNLGFKAYILFLDEIGLQSQRLAALKELGFDANGYALTSDPKKVVAYCQESDDRRKTIPYDIDGMVIKVDDISTCNSLGQTSKAPKWATAWKFKPERAFTKLVDISVQVGRTGSITPVANVEPVVLNGTTVKRATLHNYDEILLRLDLHEGDTIIMEKGGEIIPKVVGVDVSKRVPGAERIAVPHNCPECGSVLEKPEDIVDYYCVNKQCPAQLQAYFEHFVSRKAMNVESVGPEIIADMIEAGLISHPIDLYDLTDSQVRGVGSLKEKGAARVMSGIESSKDRGLAALIYGLGIRYVGESTAKNIAKVFVTIEDLIAASLDDIRAVDDVGETTSESLYNYIRDNSELLLTFKRLGVRTNHIVDIQGNSFENEIVCITGSLPNIDRESAKVILEKNGAKVTGSVSKKTTILVHGEDAGSKLAKATELGTLLLTWEEVLVRISG